MRKLKRVRRWCYCTKKPSKRQLKSDVNLYQAILNVLSVKIADPTMAIIPSEGNHYLITPDNDPRRPINHRAVLGLDLVTQPVAKVLFRIVPRANQGSFGHPSRFETASIDQKHT